MSQPPVVRTTLRDQPLPPGTVTAHVEVRRISMGPSVAAGPHRHNGAVFGSIERGSVVFRVGDEPEVVLRAGHVFYQPAGAVITAFDATDEGVVFLGYFLLGDQQGPEIEVVR